jgi:hypothetical protein
MDTHPPIDTMSFEQIAAFMGSIDGRTAVRYGGTLTKRLYEIALYDNHVPQTHREGANKLLGLIKQTMEMAYSHSPEAITKYREANATMEEGARRIGVGSLPWLLLENKVSTEAEMVEFVARPEHRHLRENFYAIIDNDLAEKVKAKIAERPDPQFLGEFLVAQVFLNIRFNIPQEKFRQFSASAPEDVRELVPVWSLLYLMWLMRMSAKLRYGDAFEGEMMRAAYGRMMAAPQQEDVSSLTIPFANSMRKWFDMFDTEIDPTFALKPVPEGDFPAAEWKIAMGLLVSDNESPYYVDADKIKADLNKAVAEVTARMGGVDATVARALARAKNAALQFIMAAPQLSQRERA